MRISRNWLTDYLDFDDLSPTALEDLITTRVAEVDRVERIGVPLEGALVAVITRSTPHPKKKSLLVLELSLGNRTATVVSGDPTCSIDQQVAFVPAGGVISPKTEVNLLAVEAREFSGILSEGVICSEAELGIGPADDQVFRLPISQKSILGQPVSKLVGPPDTVLVLDNKSLTHRPDLWGHFGFAREMAAILGRPLKKKIDAWSDATESGQALLAKEYEGKTSFEVEIEPRSQCRRFSGLEYGDVVLMPSPLWMRRRLSAVGAGVRNFLVDLSNYVMHDIGQPNHAYDADLLRGSKILVRRARKKEEFIGLDDQVRQLSEEDVVIADGQQVVALAGVMGGKHCSIQNTTKRLFLESANFDPVLTRITAKRHQLRTDASNRFEKNQSAYAVPLALHRFTELLLQEQPKTRVLGKISDAFPEKPKRVQVSGEITFLEKRLGLAVGVQRISGILTALGFAFTPGKDGNSFAVDVPYYRATRDIERVEDLVEELGRVVGYENIPERAPVIKSVASQELPFRALEEKLRDLLRGAGFSEFYNYSFMNPKHAESLGYGSNNLLSVLNPIDADLSVLRSTLIPGTIEVVERNARFCSNFALFELGRTYVVERQNGSKKEGKDPNVCERRMLSLAYCSGRPEGELSAGMSPALEQGADIHAALGVIRKIVKLVTAAPLRISNTFRREEGNVLQSAGDRFKLYRPWMHPHRNGTMSSGDRAIGIIAEVRPDLIPNHTSRVVLCEIDLGQLQNQAQNKQRFAEIPKFPDSFLELSVVMPKQVVFEELELLLRSAVPRQVLRTIEVLQVYSGSPLSAGEKSVSVRLSFQAEDRTLSGNELKALQDNIVTQLSGRGFPLRT